MRIPGINIEQNFFHSHKYLSYVTTYVFYFVSYFIALNKIMREHSHRIQNPSVFISTPSEKLTSEDIIVINEDVDTKNKMYSNMDISTLYWSTIWRWAVYTHCVASFVVVALKIFLMQGHIDSNMYSIVSAHFGKIYVLISCCFSVVALKQAMEKISIAFLSKPLLTMNRHRIRRSRVAKVVNSRTRRGTL